MIYSQLPRKVYFLKDHVGSIRASVQDTSTAPVVGYDDYDPWGYILGGRSLIASGWGSQAGIVKNKFTGKEWDDEFGLNWNYFGARYYDREIGRWLVPDPVGQDWSPYSYAGNSPVIAVDPDGRFWWIAAAAVIGGGLNLYQNWDYIKNPWEGVKFFALGAASGALSTTGPLGSVLGGVITSGGNAALRGNPGAIFQQAIIGGITGGAGSIGGQLGSKLGGVAINGFQINSPFLKGLVGGGLGGALGGFAAGSVGASITGANFSQAIGAGLSGAATGITIGASAGAVRASVEANKRGISPLTGRPKDSITIGEGMDRLLPVARDLKSETIANEWPDNIKPFRHRLATPDGLSFNKQWIEVKMQQGYYIYDAGPIGTNSPYYNLEIGAIRGSNYTRVYIVQSYQFWSIRIIRIK